jgi:HSP20 family protein
MEKWDPFQDLVRLRNIFNELFDRTFQKQIMDEDIGLEYWAPHVDIYESPSEFVILAELPGIKKDEISIELNNNKLLISGERKASYREGEAAFHRVERRHGPFRREVEVPMRVDEKNILADIEAGVLRVVLPLTQQDRSKKIVIKPRA